MQGKVDQMDARYFDSDQMPNDTFQDLFKYSDQKTALKKALHITKPDRFSKLNSTVAGLLTDRVDNSAGLFTDLLAQGVKVLVMIGQFDMKDGVRQTLEWTKQVTFPDRSGFDS